MATAGFVFDRLFLPLLLSHAYKDRTVREPGSALDEQTKGRQKRRAFTEDELRRILAVADNEWRGMVLVGAYGGLRLGDVSLLCWQNVDLENRELRFTSEKTGREMVVPIAGPLHAYCLEIAKNDEPTAPLFPRAFELRSKKNPGFQTNSIDS